MKKFFILSLLAILLYAPSSFAQEQTLVATVNLQDASITQEGHTFNIDFNITNRIGIQPGIKYALTLSSGAPTSSVVVDTFVFEESLSLGENSSVHKTIQYKAPDSLYGEYTLTLTSQSESGFPFGTVILGKVSLEKGASEGVLLNTKSCYLTIPNETNTPKYTSQEKVQLSAKDTLVSTCELENTGSKEFTAIPTITTHSRSIFGQVVEGALALENAPVTILPGEKKLVSTTLPLPTAPQIYVVALSYGSGSNEITYRYEIEGMKGSIENIVVDKNTYSVGEIAYLSFFWTQNTGEDAATPELSFVTSLSNEDGSACAETETTVLNVSQPLLTIKIPVTASCTRPQATVRLVDAAKGDLDSATFAMTTEVPPSSTLAPMESSDDEKTGPTLWVSFVGLLLALVLLVYGIHKREKSVPTIAPLLFLLMMGMFMGSAHTVSADTMVGTYTHPTFGCTYVDVFNANLTKASYAPNESIQVDWTMQMTSGCYTPISDSYEVDRILELLALDPTAPIGVYAHYATIAETPALANRNALNTLYSGRGPAAYYGNPIFAPQCDASYSLRLEGHSIDGGPVGSVEMSLPFTVSGGLPCGTDAGANQSITLSTTSAAPSGAYARAAAGITTNTWSYVSGPGPVPTISGGNTLSPTFSGMTAAGTYTFRLTTSGPKGNFASAAYSGSDTMTVTVSAPVVPTGSLSAPNCTILAGQSSCVSSITWDTFSVTSPNVSQNGTQFSTAPSSLGTNRTINYGANTFELKDGAATLATQVATAVCPPIAPWNSTICAGAAAVAPTLNFSGSPTTITSGDPSTLTWTVSGTADGCWASGGWTGWKSLTGSTETVSPTSNTTYTLECWNQGVSNGPQSVTITVSAVPPPSIPCPGTTISGCVLPATAHGDTAGSCNASTYSGSCSYTCNNGTWGAPSNNSCVLLPPPPVTGPPVLTTPSRTVKRNTVVPISWDTNNGNESLCSLTGGSLGTMYSPIPLVGTTATDLETGTTNQTITGRTTYTLTCPSGVITLTIEVIADGSET